MRPFLTLLLFVVGLSIPLLAPRSAQGQIFVTNSAKGTVGEYSLTGAPINPNFVTGLAMPVGITYSNGDIYVTDAVTGGIDVYNATNGAFVKASLANFVEPTGIDVAGGNVFIVEHGERRVAEYNDATGNRVETLAAQLLSANDLILPTSLCVSGDDLFVVSLVPIPGSLQGIIGEYSTSTGLPINTSLVSGLTNPQGLALSGDKLFVTDDNGRIGEYTTSGDTVNATLVPNSGVQPEGISVYGGNLYVVDFNGTVQEYSESGTLIHGDLVSGLSSPYGIVVVPEPSTFALGVFGGAALLRFAAQSKRAIRTAAQRKRIAAAKAVS